LRTASGVSGSERYPRFIAGHCRQSRHCRRPLLARLYGWRKRTENELARLLGKHRWRRPDDAPEVVRRVDELIATRQAISDEIASLRGQRPAQGRLCSGPAIG
jgi:hypothetical protein